MLNTLFGEGQYAIKLLFAFIIIFGVLALALWLLRRFGGERLGNGAARGRQPRLAVIDQANVDSRRRLILVRRDNVEHLLMIGGASDVLVEANILRGAVTARESAVVRPASAPDTLPRAVPLGEGAMWPLQPEPAPRLEPRLEAAPRQEAAPRPQRPPRVPAAVETEPQHWEAAEPEPAPQVPSPKPARERMTSNDPLAGLAQELAREPSTTDREGAPQPRRPPLRRDLRARPGPPPLPTPSSSVGQTRLMPPADHNIAEMAQRLEAALRRPTKGNEVRPAPPPPKPEFDAEERDEAEPASTGTARAAQPADASRPDLPRPEAQSADAQRPDVSRSARDEPKPAPRSESVGAPQRSLYDSLEQEMASLLGRPNNKAE